MTRRIWLGTIALVVIALCGIALVFLHTTRKPLPDLPGTLRHPALSASVEIVRNEDGVAHIYARTKRDLLFAQGYVHAADRWWTMEFYRHVARGELSALIGRDKDAIANDTLMRTMGFGTLADADYAALDGPTKALLDSFAAGVTAYIGIRSPGELAVEYSLLQVGGVEPNVRPWHASDSLAVAKLLGFSLSAKDIDDEIERAAVRASVDRNMYAEWAPEYAYDRHPTVVPVAGGSIDRRTPTRNIGTGPIASTAPAILSNRYFAALPGRADGHGSNAWVVSGARTVSGRPMLAVDPHQGLDLPNTYHEIGLHLRPDDGPAFDIYGFAAAPFFLVLEGMNSAGSWGTTNVSGGDTLDLYRLTINPDDPDEYLWDGDWRKLDVRAENIAIGGETKPIQVNVRRTHFGPVIPSEDGASVYAARWGGFERSTIARASLAIPFATSFHELRIALQDWDYPPTNFLYAGQNGEIGFQEAGRFPLRPSGADASLPQDGSRSEKQWRGYLPYEMMPSVRNPERGFIVSANNRPVAEDYFRAFELSRGGNVDADALRFASPGYRAARIEHLLAAHSRHDAATFRTIQLDTVVAGLSDRLALFDAARFKTLPCARALAGWDGSFDTASTGATAFARFWSRVLDQVYRPHVPQVTFGVGVTQLQSLEAILENPDSGWWDDPGTRIVERRDDRLPALLDGICDDAEDWGSVHRAHFEHPLFSASGIPLLEGWGSLSPIATFGGVGTVSIGRWNEGSGNYAPRHIPAYRFIHDLARPHAWSINSTGQSSHPASPHYADQTHRWAQGKYRRVELNPPSRQPERNDR